MSEVTPTKTGKGKKFAIYLVNILLLAVITAGIIWAVKEYRGTDERCIRMMRRWNNTSTP